MNKSIRLNEYKILAYRILLAYVFYFIARLFFLIYNYKLLKVDSVAEFFVLSYHGLVFDTTAILYVNLLFILLSILPFWVNTTKKYQTLLFWVYFLCNAIAYATNFLDFIYYRFTYSRSTIALLDFVKNESNKGSLFSRFIITYWHVYVLFFLLMAIWVFLYKKVRLKPKPENINKIFYFSFSILGLLIVAAMIIGGIRGDFKKSTRPINIIDANRHVIKPEHADVVLNTPFAIIRTFNTTSFKKVNLVTKEEVEKSIQPIKKYSNNPLTKPNIVLIITESYGREYIGAFNKENNIKDYVSYTPFVDSLAQHSLIFTNAFANGSKSIHGMSSVIAGIPSFRDAFTSSPYPKQKIQSLVSTLEELGYDTSFFHGAANGSMGFLGFGNILGFDHYYGRTEFDNDNEFDGSWGIWDEPFLQFMKNELDKKKTPFFSTVFTVSSHEPFVIPEKYTNTFPKGNIQMHQPVGYTDYAFKKFFEAAKKTAWFKNTLFIITADHCNQTYYPYYNQVVTRQAVPILFYKPDGSLAGVNKDFAQQIDIYPTVLDMIGYPKPFRSWGRSLVGDKNIKPFVYNFNGGFFQFMQGDYIIGFDGKEIIGVYLSTDLALEKNLLTTLNNNEIEKAKITAKAFYQDYMERIIDKKMYY
jgi:phosphoglycerol transferase MdoB-like AlkP superfamily enzyme